MDNDKTGEILQATIEECENRGQTKTVQFLESLQEQFYKNGQLSYKQQQALMKIYEENYSPRNM